MYSKLNNKQKELLNRYGRLHRIHHSPLNKISVKQEYEATIQEMARQQLTHKDYEEYERMEKYLKTANELLLEEKTKESNRSSAIIKIIIGIILLIVGVGLSADTDFFFYGAIFTGLGLIISGGIEVYSPSPWK